MEQTASDDQLDAIVGKVVEEYLQRLERGERPPLEEFVERHPEIADLLKTVIPALHATDGMTDVFGDVASVSGRQLGDFRILRQLGRGGMGIVYEAEQISMQRRVALKVLPLAGLVDELKIRRFRNEVRAVAALDHPNIVSVYTVGEERGIHYYAMQLVRGRSLAEVISSLRRVSDKGDDLNGSSICHITSMGRAADGNEAHDVSGTGLAGPTRRTDGGARHDMRSEPDGTVPQSHHSTIPHSSRREYFRSVAALGIQAATALQYAHDEGIIHRDIKPANLVLDTSSKLYITDFGLARIETDAGVTMSGDLIGTLRYMAPEQALGNGVVLDPRVDIYSLGVTLYELLTLRPAYAAEDRHHLLKQIAHEEPTRLRRVDATIPAELETIVHKAMSKEVRHRYLSAQELADDLRSHLNNEPIKAKPPTTSEAIVKWTRRNPSLAWATIITLSLITTTLAASTLLISRQLTRAKRAEGKAKTAQGEAAAQARQLARRNYLLHIGSADNALLQEKYLRAQTELDECAPEQRGREWHYLAQCLHTTFPLSLPGAEQPVFTHDGKRLIAIGDYHGPERCRVRTWDLESGEVVNELRHDSELTHHAVSSDETWIAAGDEHGNLIVWDAKSGENPWPPVKVHHGGLLGLAFSPDGRLVATCGRDRTLVVTSATNGETLFRLGPFPDETRKVMFSPNGQWIASGMQGKHPAILIDVTTGNIAARFSEEGGNMLPTFAPSGNRIATAHIDGSIKLWSWDGIHLRELTSWKASEREILSLSFSADGSRLVSSEIMYNRNIVWDTATGKQLAAFTSQDHVYWSAFSPDGNVVALFSLSNGIRIWRYGARRLGREIKVLTGAAEATFSPHGTHILVATPMYYDGSRLRHRVQHYYTPEHARILDAESGNLVRSTEEAVYAASWSPDGREIIATCVSGESIRTYDVATGEPLRDFRGNTGRFTISRVDPSGQRLVSFSTDGSIRAWNFSSGEEECMGQINGSDDGFMGLGANFSCDVNFLGLDRGQPVIWDTRSMTRACTIPQPGYWAKKFTFSHDGNRVYISGISGRLMRVDTLSGQQAKRFVGHSGQVRAVAIAPDEKQIVAGDTTGHVIVWDVESQRALVTLDDGGRLVTSVDWSPDGHRIVAGREDGTIQIWTLPRSN